jgi:molecular chaperone GrpE
MSSGEFRGDSHKPPMNSSESETIQMDPLSEVKSEKTPSKVERSNSNETEELSKELEAERRKSADLSKRILYLQSDLINLQRQNERRVMEARDETKLRYLEEIISVKEDLERALSIGKSANSNALMDGLRMLLSRIEGTLRMDEIEMINVSPGSPFDIKFHEAVAYSEGNNEKEGTILSVISNGYTMRGKVIKPVLVEVSRQNRGSKRSAVDEGPKVMPVESEYKDSKVTKVEEITTATNSKETKEN